MYRSTDSSAPVLTGQVGTLISLLDAVLVNGYGSKTAAGWTKAYSGTNKAVYRNSSTNGTGHYLRVDDTNASYGRAYVTGGETASAVDTLANPFPAATLTYAGWGKSNTTDATARPWVILADDQRFYIFVQTGENGTDWAAGFFGDIFSYVSNDAYRSLLCARYSTSGASAQTYSTEFLAYMYPPGSTTTSTITMPRTHAGVYGPQSVGMHTDMFKCANKTSPGGVFWAGAQTGITYPNPVNSGLIMAPVWVHYGATSAVIVRGYMPGLWCPAHNRPLANNDTFSGVGAMAGKTFEAFNVYSAGQLILETSDTWS
jgi:hypothetical protein